MAMPDWDQLPPSQVRRKGAAGANTDQGTTGKSKAKVGKGKSKGGKPPLEKSNPVMFQIYERIRQEHHPCKEYADTVERLKGNKDFTEQVRAAGLKLNGKLVRRALAFFDQRKRDHARKKQETDPT
jgi:hypothetical protein